MAASGKSGSSLAAGGPPAANVAMAMKAPTPAVPLLRCPGVHMLSSGRMGSAGWGREADPPNPTPIGREPQWDEGADSGAAGIAQGERSHLLHADAHEHHAVQAVLRQREPD